MMSSNTSPYDAYEAENSLEASKRASSNLPLPADQSYWHYIFPIILIFLPLALYFTGLRASFIGAWDDGTYILANERVQDFSLAHLAEIWTQAYNREYLPLTYTFLMFEKAFWGNDPTAFRLVNLGLHLANTLLVYSCLGILLNRRALAFWAALLFALHPLQVESVAWIAQQKTLLSACFFLLAFYCHLYVLKKKQERLMILAYLCFALSLLAKPAAILAPLLTLYLDFAWTKRSWNNILARNLPYLVTSLLIGSLALLAQQQNGGLREAAGDNPLEVMQYVLWGIGGYFAALVAPINLNNLYLYDPNKLGLLHPPIWFGLLCLLGSLALAILQPLGKRLSAFGVIWFWALLFPLLNLIPVGFIRADRFIYLPSIMFFALVVLLGWRIWESFPPRPTRPLLLGLGGIIIFAYLGLTFSRIPVWENAETLWKDHLEDYPNSNVGWFQLGVEQYNRQDLEGAAASLDRLPTSNYAANVLRATVALQQQDYLTAIDRYQLALQANPDDQGLRNSLGLSLIQYGLSAYNAQDYQRALQAYLFALEFVPAEPILHNSIGYTYQTIGRYQEALVAYTAALELNPQYDLAWVNLGDTAFYLGEYTVARDAYSQALNLGSPLNTNSAGNLCVALAELQEDLERAISFCQQAVELEPTQILYWGRLVYALVRFGQVDLALQVVEQFTQINPVATPSDPSLGYQQSLGNLLLDFGIKTFETDNYNLTLNIYQQAFQFIPNEPILLNNIGYTLYNLNNFEQAITAYQTALQLDPSYSRALINLGDAYIPLSQFENARLAYEQALALGGDLPPQSDSNMCLALAELGAERDQTLSFCRAALESEPDNALFLGRGAYVFLRLQEYDEALVVAQRAVELNPTLSLNHRVLGDALAALGNIEAARQSYQNALSIDPQNQAAREGLARLGE
jgi:tetratricopeptide (TPR) repeat protein